MTIYNQAPSPAHPTGVYAAATTTDWTAPTGEAATGLRCATAGSVTLTCLDGSSYPITLAAGEILSIAFTVADFPTSGAAALDIYRAKPTYQ